MKKTAVIELLNSFEDEFDFREFIQKLTFIEKVERGLQDVAEGKIKGLKQVKSAYNAAFVTKVHEGRKQVKNGETKVININDL